MSSASSRSSPLDVDALPPGPSRDRVVCDRIGRSPPAPFSVECELCDMRPRRAGKPIFCRVDFSTNGLEDFVDLLGRVVVRRVVRQIADEPNLLENVRHAAFRYGTEFVGLAVSCHGLFLLDGRGDGHDAPLALASTASGASRAGPIGAAFSSRTSAICRR